MLLSCWKKAHLGEVNCTAGQGGVMGAGQLIVEFMGRDEVVLYKDSLMP